MTHRNTIIVYVEGGVVHQVCTTDPDARVILVDFDCEDSTDNTVRLFSGDLAVVAECRNEPSDADQLADLERILAFKNQQPYATVEDLEAALGGFVRNPFSEDDSNEPVDKFETYGRDIQWVLERLQTHPRTVFTFQDSDEGDKLILSGGYHLCNRIYYVATQNPVPSEYEYGNISIVVSDYETDTD